MPLIVRVLTNFKREIMLAQKHTTFLDLIRARDAVDVTKVTLCLELLSITDAIDKSCAEKLELHQLSESRLLLLTLLNEKGALTPQAAAEMCGVTKATMTQQINTLFKYQLIDKESVLEDRRKYLLKITEKGQQVIAQALLEHTQWIEKLTDSLSIQEMSQFREILEKINQNIDKN